MFNFNFIINLEDIDIYNIATWPKAIRVAVVVTSVLLIIILFKWLMIDSKVESLDGLLNEEKKLRSFFVAKQKLLVNINEYKDQMKTIESRLATLVQLLPSANEVPSLVNQISQAGRESGLSFKEIAMLPEKKFRYYVEMPIKMKVSGNYHQLGDFISRVTELSRIVTFHDFTLAVTPEAQKQRIAGEALDLEILAKTYRYLATPESETKAGASQKPDENKISDIK